MPARRLHESFGLLAHVFAALLCVSAAGCAREARAVRPLAPGAGAGWILPKDYAWPPKGASPAPASVEPNSVLAKTSTDPLPKPRGASELASVLPAGESCLNRLRAAGVDFRSLDETRGIATPIAVQGRIGGIRYWAQGGTPLICDCRLALALSQVAGELSALGIDEMRFSGAYVYRLSQSGRLSLHAYGLALDVHELKASGRAWSVEKDFARGRSFGSEEPLPNALVRKLRESRLFRELLTPDDNADHHDHVHLGVAPLAEDLALVNARGLEAPPAPARVARAPRSSVRKLKPVRSAVAKSRR